LFINISNMQIVRSLWGDYENYINDIEESKYGDVVYVWGEDNNEFLKKLGYHTKLISKNKCNYCDINNQFIQKLQSFKFAEEDFGEFLFLDWDVKELKPLDEGFYNELRSQDFSASLYGYPKEFTNLKGLVDDWTDKQINLMDKHCWFYDDIYILPNAGFVYSNRKGFGEDLIKIVEDYQIETLIEEFAIQIYSNMSLNDYILTHESKVINGRPEWYSVNVNGVDIDSPKRINNYVTSLIEKDLYLIHT
jgi:hypothetical protein